MHKDEVKNTGLSEEQLLEELEELRRRNAEMERSESGLRRAEEALEHRNQELTVLVNVANILVQPGSFEERVVRVLEELLPIAQADRALFLVGDHRQEVLTVVAQAGPTEPESPTISVSYESASGVAFQEGRPIVVNDYVNHPLATAGGVERGVKSGVFLPVKSREGVMGVLDIISLEADHFTRERVNALTAIGGGLGMLLENARLDELIQQNAEELARSNADLEQFAYVASHDLQEPLRMVTSYVQILEEDYDGQLDADAHRYIGYAVDGATRMRHLIEDLLEYSRVSSQKAPLERTECNDVVEGVLGDLNSVLEDSGALVTYEDLPTVRGDASQLGQLFQNLVSNGIKFSGDKPARASSWADSDATWAIWSRLSTEVAMVFSSATTAFTALSTPLFNAMGLAPAATFLNPSLMMDWASTTDVVVPSPAASLVLEAASFSSCAPMFSKGSGSSISFAMVTPSLHTWGGPNFLSRITFLPLGPRVIFTVSANVSIPVFRDLRASSA